MTAARYLALGALVVLAFASLAGAQTPSFRPRQVVFAAGGVVMGSHSIGSLDVTIPRNATGASTPFTLLRAESTLDRAVGVDARVAVTLTPRISVEVAGVYATPELGVAVSQDAELSGSAFAAVPVEQFTLDVSAIYHLPFATTRLRPYAIGGAGYLRQLPRGRLMVETGSGLHVGGGVHYWLRGERGKGHPLGVRGEVRYVRRFGGVDFADRARGLPAVSVLAFVGL